MKLWLLVSLAIMGRLQHAEACGGCSTCSLVDAACVPTEVRTVTRYSSSGWWLSVRTTARTEYQYYTGTPYCCAGYTLSGSTCTASVLNCGGCDGTNTASQQSCVRPVQQKTSRLSTVAYSCGGWWWNGASTCYRQEIYYSLERKDISFCCNGYNLVGSVCQKDNSPKSCGQSKYSRPGIRLTQIVGGYDAYANEFPWQLRLSMAGTGLCGGTLIGAEWVLTAAHCVNSYITNPSAVAVIAGDHRYANYDTTEQLRYGATIFVHDGYDTINYENDIALVRLNSPVTLNDEVAVACLPESCDEVYVGDDVILSGWGRSSAGNKDSATVRFNDLQFTWMVVKSKQYCENFFGPMGTFLCVSDNQGDTKRSPCFGDSGGPMVQAGKDGRFTVMGVASFVADKGCAMGLPSGYTDVRPYLRWMKQIVY